MVLVVCPPMHLPSGAPAVVAGSRRVGVGLDGDGLRGQCLGDPGWDGVAGEDNPLWAGGRIEDLDDLVDRPSGSTALVDEQDLAVLQVWR